MLLGAVRTRHHNPVAAVEHIWEGVLDAGKLGAGHGVAADVVHPFGQGIGRLHDGSLDAADIGDQAAGAELLGVLAEKAQQGVRRGTEDGHIRPSQGGGGVQGGFVNETVVQGIVRRLLPAHNADQIAVLKPLQGGSQGAADETQSNNDDGALFHIKSRSFPDGHFVRSRRTNKKSHSAFDAVAWVVSV